MDVAVNGIPLCELIQSLDIQTYLLQPYTTGASATLDLLFNISAATGQSTAARFLSAHIYNRAAGRVSMSEGLLALTCVLVSSKYLETRHVAVEELARFADGRASKAEITQAETEVMTALDYLIRTPTLYDWVSLLTLWISPYLSERVWQRLRATSLQLSELLYESGSLLAEYRPALVAGGVLQAAVYILTKSVGECPLTAALTEITQAHTQQLLEVAELVMGEALGWQFLQQFTVA